MTTARPELKLQISRTDIHAAIAHAEEHLKIWRVGHSPDFGNYPAVPRIMNTMAVAYAQDYHSPEMDLIVQSFNLLQTRGFFWTRE